MHFNKELCCNSRTCLQGARIYYPVLFSFGPKTVVQCPINAYAPVPKIFPKFEISASTHQCGRTQSPSPHDTSGVIGHRPSTPHFAKRVHILGIQLVGLGKPILFGCGFTALGSLMPNHEPRITHHASRTPHSALRLFRLQLSSHGLTLSRS